MFYTYEDMRNEKRFSFPVIKLFTWLQVMPEVYLWQFA